MALIADAPMNRADMAHGSTLSGQAPTFGQIGAGFLGLVARRLAAWREYRRTLAELQGLDDRTLRDLSLSRGELRHVARNAAGL
ncbi:MAG: DUF1127 domain-containing protein [Pseudomonadota bacterium]|nr:DUF1127 domain-containing protein [Pseudomonadota bacterium]MEE3099856.1 DUF1127 domain-containing protein [Pseudomonadota bacterium]